VIARCQYVAFRVQQDHILRFLGKLKHIVTQPDYPGWKCRLVVFGLMTTFNSLVIAVTLQLPAPQASEVHIMGPVIIFEYAEIYGITAVHGSIHGFEGSLLWYVFQSFKNSWRPWTDGDRALSEVMLTAWSNFAKFGDPNGQEGGEWTPCTTDNPQFMVFKLDESGMENSEMGDPLKP